MKTRAASLALLLLAVPSTPFGSEPPAGAPAQPPAIPGITAPDAFPNACVDCHLNYREQNLDVRFSTLLAAWQQGAAPKLLEKARAAAPAGVTLTGKHPAVSGAVSDVPRKCLACHGKASTKAPPFAVMLHAIHLEGGAENHFVSLFGGSCTHCHKLDAKTGKLTVPSAAER